uniref:Uncharacterized protein n=1 Tax=viral metagenome TaxID=1070528 RepID=A0A6C0ATV7_9ZZZZ
MARPPVPLQRVLQLCLVDVGADPADALDTSALDGDPPAQAALNAIVRKDALPTRGGLRALLRVYGVRKFRAPLGDVTPRESAEAAVVVDTTVNNALHVAIVTAWNARDEVGFWVSRAMEFPRVWAATARAVGADPAAMYGAAQFDLGPPVSWADAASSAVQPVLRYMRGVAAFCYLQWRILSAALPRERRAPLGALYSACVGMAAQARDVLEQRAADSIQAVDRAAQVYVARVRDLTAVATHQRPDGAVTVTQTHQEMRHAWRALTGMARLSREHAGVMYVVRAVVQDIGAARSVALLDSLFGRQWSGYLHAATRGAAGNPEHTLRRVGAAAYALPPLRGMHAGYSRLANDAAPSAATPVADVTAFMDARDGDVPARDVTISRLAAASPLLLTTLLPRSDALPPDALYEFDSLQSVRLEREPSSPPELRRLFSALPRSEELWACLDSVLQRCRAAALQGLRNFNDTVRADDVDEAGRRALLAAYCKQHGMPYELLRDLDAQARGVPIPGDERDA